MYKRTYSMQRAYITSRVKYDIAHAMEERTFVSVPPLRVREYHEICNRLQELLNEALGEYNDDRREVSSTNRGL